MIAEGLPHWPALMDEATAAAYCGGVCAETFLALTSRYKVAPVDMGGMRLRRWRKADLDRMIDSMPPRGVPSAAAAANEPESWGEAIARAGRRRR